MSISTPEELTGMQTAGVIARQVLEAMRQQVRSGVTTGELDTIGSRVMTDHGAQSAPALVYGFPGYSCISVNDEIVHGIPGDRVLQEGDLVKLDVTIEKDGFMADTAATVAVGRTTQANKDLIGCAERAFAQAMLVARAGFTVFDIGRAVEKTVRRQGFSVVQELCGHGIGRTIHEEPEIPNFADPQARTILTEGLVITVEPIIASGSGEAVHQRDGWTIKTRDRKASAHYEHTIVITKGRPLILTAA